MAANEELMGQLHNMLARRYVRMLVKEQEAQEAEVSPEDIEDGVAPFPYEMSEQAAANALKMLKDSNVTMAPSKKNVTGELANKLAQREKARGIPPKDMPRELQDALSNMGHPSLTVQ